MAEKKSNDFADSTLWRIITVTGEAITLNLLFLAACLPTVIFAVLKVVFSNLIFDLLFFASFITVGPAVCGLFSALRYFLRGDGWFRGFKAGYKTNILQMMAVSLFGSAFILYMGDIVFAIANNFEKKALGALIPNSVILALAIAFVTSCIVYNVFFPRRLIDLLTESASFVFKAPLQLLITGVLLWAPVFVSIAYLSQVLPFVLVFMALYFSVAAAIGIGLLKEPLIKVLTKKRESGELPPNESDDEEE